MDLVFLHLRVECSWLGHLTLAAYMTPHRARLRNQPKKRPTFCSISAVVASYPTNQSNS